MKPLVIGTREDVAGFALAGVDGVVCTTVAEAEAAIAKAGEETLVMLSNDFSVLRAPFSVVLPRRS